MRRLLVVAVAALLAPAVAAGAAVDVPPGAVAVVAGEPITQAELDALMERARRGYQQQKRAFPRVGTPAYETLERQAVEYLVTQTIFRQQAAAHGVVVTDEEVAARRRAIVRQYFGGSEARFRRHLARQGMTEADFRREIVQQFLAERLYRAVTAEVTVTEAEIVVHYNAHLDDFTRPPSRVVRHILVRTRALAVSLRARIVRGESFATLARRYSTDPGTRNAGGRLTVGRGETVAPFNRVAFSLRTGALSQPVRTQYGWHLIQPLSAVRPGSVTSLDAARERIEQLLLQEKRGERMAAWLDEVRAAANIEYAPGFEP